MFKMLESLTWGPQTRILEFLESPMSGLCRRIVNTSVLPGRCFDFCSPALPTKPVSITTTMVTRTPLLLSTLKKTTALFTAPHVFARGRNASSQQSLKPASGGLGVARSRGEAEVAHKNAAVARTQEATASQFDTSGML